MKSKENENEKNSDYCCGLCFGTVTFCTGSTGSSGCKGMCCKHCQWEKKQPEDEIVVINQTLCDLMDLRIEVFNKKKQVWMEYGIGEFRKINDTDKVDSDLAGKLKKFSHVALIPSTGEIKVVPVVDDDDLKIFVQPANELETGISVEFVKPTGKFRDNIRLVSRMSKPKNSFFVVYGMKGEEKKFIGIASLRGNNDTCYVSTAEKASDFERYIIAGTDGEPFTVEANCKRNDMYVYIKD